MRRVARGAAARASARPRRATGGPRRAARHGERATSRAPGRPSRCSISPTACPSSRRAGFSASRRSAAAFDELVRELERLGDDKDVRGVLVRFGTARIGLARARGARRAARRARREDPVYCHADELRERARSTSPRAAAREIWVSPAGERRAVGIAAQTRLLAQAARRGARPRRRLPAGRQVQGRGGAVHARRAEPRGARVARGDARATCARLARRHRRRRGRRRVRGRVEDGPYSPAARRSSGSSTRSATSTTRATRSRRRRRRARARSLRRGRQRAAATTSADVLRALAGDSSAARAGRARARTGASRWRAAAAARRGRRASPSGGSSATLARLEKRRRREGGRPAHRLARRQRARERSPLARS